MSPPQPWITYVAPCVLIMMVENNTDEMKMDFTHPDLCWQFFPTAKELKISKQNRIQHN